jgi:cell division protein FtsA
MGTDKTLVAIELGSSSIRGIIGQRRADGTLLVLGYERENTPDCVRKGVIFNIDKTVQAISNIIKRIEERQKVYVNKVYVGISGQSLRTVKNEVIRNFDVKVSISDEIVDGLMQDNCARIYDDCEILDVAPQEFRVGSRMTNEPVGVMADHIEGYYQNVIARTVLSENIKRCFQALGKEIAGFYISPLLLANYLLTDIEKRSGCALVDLGADTTTVAVYEKNILRHLVVIPLGGNNITADIASALKMEMEEAEQLKRSFGSAYYDEEDSDSTRMINISNGRTVEEKRLRDIIEARQQEILENVKHQISVFSEQLLAGVIFTGAAANIKNLENAFATYAHFDKQIKTRFNSPTPEYTTSLKLDPQANNIATLVAMLRRANVECTSEKPLEPTLDFDAPQTDTLAASQPAAGEGVVTKTEPKPADVPDEPEDVKLEGTDDEEDKPKQPGFFSKFGKKMGQILSGLVEEN